MDNTAGIDDPARLSGTNGPRSLVLPVVACLELRLTVVRLAPSRREKDSWTLSTPKPAPWVAERSTRAGLAVVAARQADRGYGVVSGSAYGLRRVRADDGDDGRRDVGAVQPRRPHRRPSWTRRCRRRRRALCAHRLAGCGRLRQAVKLR